MFAITLRKNSGRRPVIAMKYLSAVAFAALLTMAPCHADIQNSLFRLAYACPDRGSSSVCIYGAVPAGKQVTVLARDWKSAAAPKGHFSNDDKKTITRLQVATTPPKGATMIAVLTAPETLSLLPLQEVKNDALVERINQHVRNAKELNLDVDIQLVRTRLLRLSPTIMLSETFLTPRSDSTDAPPDTRNKGSSSGCEICENVPLMVGPNLEDLFKATRDTSVNAVDHTCGGIDLGFALSGRTYLLSHAFSCESDSYSATQLHDLSGKTPRLVFHFSSGM
jgi:hypothetical protein